MDKEFYIKSLVLVIIVLLVCSSVSACNCGKEEQTTKNCNDTTAGALTSEDIAALQKQAVIEGWSFTVGETSASKRSMDELCGLVVPEDWEVNAKFNPIEPMSTLPSKFDWRDEVSGGLPPIRDQGQCGSCWAFATMGPIEINIKIRDGSNVDLSEQWLVSCNQETKPRHWGCSGGWWAHDYFLKDPVWHEDHYRNDPCGDTGAVSENNFPYTAKDDPCNCPYVHNYFIEDWWFVGSEHGVPSVGDIKQAIYDYGPVSVAVCAGGYFMIYTGGVYDIEAICPSWNPVNHGVVLVGWDDNYEYNGNTYGVWFLRNSWDTDWGENGYMNIEYGCSKVGYAAAYIEYENKITVRCVNESPGSGLGITPDELRAIKNVKVTVTSTDGEISETEWTNKFGYCYFYNMPEDLEYEITATHSSWSQEKVEWINDNLVWVWMIGGKSRPKILQSSILEKFPILKLIFQWLNLLNKITN